MIVDLLTPLISPRFLAEERYRQGHIRIINALPGRKILGVHVPEMKRLAKQLALRSDVLDILQGFEQEYRADTTSLYYEELVVWGLTINALKCSWEERRSLLRAFLPTLDNWGVCDTFCCNTKWATRVPRNELWAFLVDYFDSHAEFEVRFSIVMSMCHLLDAEWLPTVFARLESLDFSGIYSKYTSSSGGRKHKEASGVVNGASPYYVRMGVAWLLATALAKYPEQTRIFVQGAALPEDVKRLYVRKARESFRTRNVEPY